jgi:Protein of unknown function (DUF3592)
MNWHSGITVALLIAGIGVLALVYLEFSRARATKQWPSAEATVIESKVEIEYDDGRFYRLKLSYSYMIDGKSFLGEGIRGDSSVWSWSYPASRAAKKYPEGAKVLAYYLPSDPSKAVLEPGVSFGKLVFLVGVAAIVLSNAWNQLNL